MISIFGFKLFGNPGAKLFRVSPLGQTLVHDHNANYTTGSFYDASTFGSPYAVQFGKYIYHLTPDALWRYDTVTGTTALFRSPPGFAYQNHYENSGGIYLSFDGTEWYLTYMYVNANSNLRAERYRFSNRTWVTSGTFASAADGQSPQFKYFFNNQVFWFQGSTCYRLDTLALTSGTVGGFTGNYLATSMCMHNNNIYLAVTSTTSTVNLYLFVGGAWNLVKTITASAATLANARPNRLFSDGTNMYLFVYQNTASVGWLCYQIDGMSFAETDISANVVPAFLRQSGLTTSLFRGFHVDSHSDPNSPELWLTYTAAYTTAGSSLAWYRWMGPNALMQYGGDAGEGGQDYFLSYDWTGGGHYAWTPGEPYAVMEGTPTSVAGGKTRIYFRIYTSNLLALDAPVEVQLHYSTDLEPPRNLATIANPELIEQTPETFSSTGSFNWVCPANVTSVTVECWGAGGGALQQGSFASGGAGGGAYVRGTVAVTPGNSYPLFVGAGVTANHGQDSYFIDSSTVMAKGGTGLPVNQNAGGAGGQASASVGDLKFSGGNGQTGANGSFIGGGGAAAGPSGNGVNGTPSTGGVGVFPAGSGGGSGVNGTAPGGGGGGGGVGVSTTGGDGRIVLTYAVANQGAEVNANTIQVIAGEERLWSLDWNQTVDGIPLGSRVSLAVRAIGI